MNTNKESKRKDEQVTPEHGIIAILSLALLLVPIILLVIIPKNTIVSSLLGDGKVFLIWATVFGLVFVFRGRADQFFAKMTENRKRTNK